MKSSYIIVVIIVGILIAVLYARFPYALNGEHDIARLLFLTLLASGIGLSVWSRKEAWPTRMRDATIWFAIIMALVTGYSYRDVFLKSRVAAELFPHLARVSESGEITLQKAEDGHFYLEALINGAPVLFMVDTGASDIVLARVDAERAKIDKDSLKFTQLYGTANGIVRGAPVTLAAIKIGEATFRQVRASVNESGMERSLLGMTFLNRFGDVSFKGDTLTLKP